VLRASSRLAPPRATRPCGLPARKTRDASNRLLPPVRITCTHTPYAPSSADHFRDPGRPAASEVATLHDRGTGRFHDARNASAPSSRTRILVPSSSRLPVTSVGLFDPRRSTTTRPLTPPSRPLRALPAHAPSRVLVRAWLLMVSEGARGSEEKGDRQDHRVRRLVKTDA
jgi:hypothetical protein